MEGGKRSRTSFEKDWPLLKKGVNKFIDLIEGGIEINKEVLRLTRKCWDWQLKFHRSGLHVHLYASFLYIHTIIRSCSLDQMFTNMMTTQVLCLNRLNCLILI